MWDRCTNQKRHNYYLYGGVGISVCDDWLDVEKFYAWSMNNGYNDTLSIDRIDSSGNYEPRNCRWVDTTTQSRNRKSTILVTYSGETTSLAEQCRKLNISYQMIKKRMKTKGISFEEAINITKYSK